MRRSLVPDKSLRAGEAGQLRRNLLEGANTLAFDGALRVDRPVGEEVKSSRQAKRHFG